jgi:hypothetical protein
VPLGTSSLVILRGSMIAIREILLTVLFPTVRELDGSDLRIEDAPVRSAKLNLIFDPYLKVQLGGYAGQNNAAPF